MVEIKNMSNEELQIRLLTLEEEFEAKKNAIKKMCDELESIDEEYNHTQKEIKLRQNNIY